MDYGFGFGDFVLDWKYGIMQVRIGFGGLGVRVLGC